MSERVWLHRPSVLLMDQNIQALDLMSQTRNEGGTDGLVLFQNDILSPK